MDAKKGMKGISFVPVKELSVEAKAKLDSLMKKKDERLKKIVEDYNSGVLFAQ